MSRNRDRILSIGKSGMLNQSPWTEAIGARVIRTTTQSIANATLTPLSFDTVIYDTEAQGDLGACWSSEEPTKIYARRDGYYLAGGSWSLAAAQNTVASRQFVGVRLNGITYTAGNENHTIANRDAAVAVATGMIWLSAGDYIEVIAYHDEGRSKNTVAATTTLQLRALGWLMRVG